MRELEDDDCDRDWLSIRESTRKACIEKAKALDGEFGMPVKRYIQYYDTVGLIKALKDEDGGEHFCDWGDYDMSFTSFEIQ
jgi:hypothetical protein